MSQNVDGVVENYTLDLNASLMQVLSDGTNTYLYGQGRVAQESEEKVGYFLPDGLGSIRTVVMGGEVISTRDYTPYGEELAATGVASSTFGYAGEWADSSGLQYLRARYYEPSMGRFISRDGWRGDSRQPFAYNKWLYAYGNPVKYSDPTGYIPTSSGIDTYEYVYSCNAGFIDFGHANTSIPALLYEMIAEENNQMSNIDPTYRKDVFVIEPNASALGVGTQHLKVVVKSGINNDKTKKDKVALGVYRELIENAQFTNPITYLLTYYSFEDLTSNEIAFYLYLHFKDIQAGVDPRRMGGVDEEGWIWLADVAGFPRNRDESKERTRKAFENMGVLGLFVVAPRQFDWGNPTFCSGMEEYCGENPSWPEEFTNIQPIQAQRDKDWWIYDESLDGELVESRYKGFFFLR